MSWALVTGAGIRVGRAVARALAEDGFDLILHAHSSPLDETADEVEAAGRNHVQVHADLSTPAGVEQLAARTRDVLARDGHALDLVVHNAGIFNKRAFTDISRADLSRMLAVNLEAPFFLTQSLLDSLAPEACVVFLADILAARSPPGYAHYMVSKAGLVALTKALAVEIAPHRVNAIAPGTVAFPPDMDAATRASILKRVPMGREGLPEDVARAVVFLARSPFVSGQVLAVDGGRDAVH